MAPLLAVAGSSQMLKASLGAVRGMGRGKAHADHAVVAMGHDAGGSYPWPTPQESYAIQTGASGSLASCPGQGSRGSSRSLALSLLSSSSHATAVFLAPSSCPEPPPVGNLLPASPRGDGWPALDPAHPNTRLWAQSALPSQAQGARLLPCTSSRLSVDYVPGTTIPLWLLGDPPTSSPAVSS